MDKITITGIDKAIIVASIPSAALPPCKGAPPPFNKSSADTVLRTSDNVLFRVRRAILIEASPFFEDMFSLPQPQTDQSQIEPIVIMAETSRVLNILLRLCYPLEGKIPADLKLEDVRGVLAAAKKYNVPAAVELMRGSLMSFVSKDSLRVYAIACIFKLYQEARRAAEEMARQKVALFQYVDELKDLPAGCYQRLLKFRATYDAIEPISLTFGSPALAAFSIPGIPSQYQWQDAGSPFNRPDADVIVASRDQVRFRVHSMVLRIVSPVFADMLLNPKASFDEVFVKDAASQGMPHYIPLPELSDVLKVLFGLIYHSNSLDISTSDSNLLRTVTSSAAKYSIQGPVLQLLKYRCVHDLEPLRAYVLAILCNWKDELKNIAKRTLAIDVAALQAFYEPALENIPSAPYVRLLQYHDQCCKAASATTNACNVPKFSVPGHSRYPCDGSSGFSSAFKSYITEMSAELTKRPHVSVLSAEAFYRQIIQTTVQKDRCSSCSPNFQKSCDEAIEAINSLRTAVDKAISEVQFTHS